MLDGKLMELREELCWSLHQHTWEECKDEAIFTDGQGIASPPAAVRNDKSDVI